MPANAAFGGEAARMPWVNSTGSTIVSKDVVVVASGNSGAIGVVIADILNGATGVAEVTNVWSLPKTAGEAYISGQVLYWTGTAITAASTGNTRAGRAWGPAASADTTCALKLNMT